MTDSSASRPFVAYLGGHEFHDASVVRCDRRERELDVLVKSEGGQLLKVHFSDVERVTSNCPEGMLLYALAEMKGEGSLRHFCFVNWDEKDEARLEVTAQDYRIERV